MGDYSWIDSALQIGGELYSANQNADAVGDATDEQNAGNQQYLNLLREMWETGRADQAPWLEAGQGALGQMQDLNAGDFSSFQASPDYQFTYDQGMKGLDRSAAARGSLYSGGTDADRIALGQGLASQQYGNYYNRLAGLAGIGQTTATNLAGQGSQYANSAGNQYQQMGQNNALGSLGRQSAYNNAWNNISSLWGDRYG